MTESAQRLCSECGRAPKTRLARGLCNACLKRLIRAERKAGTFERRETKRPLVERMKEKMVEQPNGCIHWAGHVNANGYGRLKVDGKMTLAHRAIYEALNGEIPDEAQIDHTCHNRDVNCPGGTACEHRRCVNPEHLEAVTRQENQRRSPLTAMGKEACTNGHQLPPRSSAPNSDGSRRRCKECEREQHRKENTGPPPETVRSLCRNGHEMNEANTYIHGTRAHCRACHRESMRARRRKAQEA